MINLRRRVLLSSLSMTDRFQILKGGPVYSVVEIKPHNIRCKIIRSASKDIIGNENIFDDLRLRVYKIYMVCAS